MILLPTALSACTHGASLVGNRTVWNSILLQPADMQAAVDMNRFPGGEGKGTARQRRDGAADILAFAPARDRRQPVGDLALVTVPDVSSHLRADQSRPDLVDGDAVRRQTQREEARQHRDAGLGDAIFAAVYRGALGIDRGDVDDGSAPAPALARRRRDHLPSDPLGEKKRAAQIGADGAVPALRGHVQEVAPDRDLDAGIVDQAVDAAERRPGGAHQPLVSCEIADIAAQECRMAAARLDAGQRVADRLVLDDVVDDDVESAIGEGPADRPPDASAASPDETGGTVFPSLSPHSPGPRG